jgi:hypothetical protein
MCRLHAVVGEKDVQVGSALLALLPGSPEPLGQLLASVQDGVPFATNRWQVAGSGSLSLAGDGPGLAGAALGHDLDVAVVAVLLSAVGPGHLDRERPHHHSDPYHNRSVAHN